MQVEFHLVFKTEPNFFKRNQPVSFKIEYSFPKQIIFGTLCGWNLSWWDKFVYPSSNAC